MNSKSTGAAVSQSGEVEAAIANYRKRATTSWHQQLLRILMAIAVVAFVASAAILVIRQVL